MPYKQGHSCSLLVTGWRYCGKNMVSLDKALLEIFKSKAHFCAENWYKKVDKLTPGSWTALGKPNKWRKHCVQHCIKHRIDVPFHTWNSNTKCFPDFEQLCVKVEHVPRQMCCNICGMNITQKAAETSLSWKLVLGLVIDQSTSFNIQYLFFVSWIIILPSNS